MSKIMLAKRKGHLRAHQCDDTRTDIAFKLDKSYNDFGRMRMLQKEEAQFPLRIAETDQKQVLQLYQKIQRGSAKIVGADGQTQSLPVSLHGFLVKLIADLAAGQSVAIAQNEAQLTSVEAARMLGVSRQFLLKVLDHGDIPHHMVGTHRRIYVRDLLAYKANRDSNRRRILDELTRAEAEDGLYDLEPPDDRAE